MNDEDDVSPELKEFIDQLIVPLLVKWLLADNALTVGAVRGCGDTCGPIAAPLTT